MIQNDSLRSAKQIVVCGDHLGLCRLMKLGATSGSFNLPTSALNLSRMSASLSPNDDVKRLAAGYRSAISRC